MSVKSVFEIIFFLHIMPTSGNSFRNKKSICLKIRIKNISDSKSFSLNMVVFSESS